MTVTFSKSLQAHFEQSGADIKAQASILALHLKAEAAPPFAGLLTTGFVGWALFWLGLIFTFPYSARIRAFYLYNDKLRGMFSLWFVPLLLTVFPFLRKRLLRPFRDALLADARLAGFDEAHWYANSTVVTPDGAVVPVGQAIPGIAGNILLIGESGLGKTMYLRLIAKRSRRILAFLNACTCDKGVLEAILRKTKEDKKSPQQAAGYWW